jgi:hypothetical protein
MECPWRARHCPFASWTDSRAVSPPAQRREKRLVRGGFLVPPVYLKRGLQTPLRGPFATTRTLVTLTRPGPRRQAHESAVEVAEPGLPTRPVDLDHGLAVARRARIWPCAATCDDSATRAGERGAVAGLMATAGDRDQPCNRAALTPDRPSPSTLLASRDRSAPRSSNRRSAATSALGIAPVVSRSAPAAGCARAARGAPSSLNTSSSNTGAPSGRHHAASLANRNASEACAVRPATPADGHRSPSIVSSPFVAMRTDEGTPRRSPPPGRQGRSRRKLSTASVSPGPGARDHSAT